MIPQQSSAAYDGAIVGYGPVGATFANLLSNYGLRIAVVEQAAAIYDKPRAITLDHEVRRAAFAPTHWLMRATWARGLAAPPLTMGSYRSRFLSPQPYEGKASSELCR
jgi:choline dehydrogenase-like flavoprotein